MTPFRHLAPRSMAEALAAGGAPGAAYVAGGTTLVDLMRLGVAQPTRLVDVRGVLPSAIEASGDGLLRIAAAARNADMAAHPVLRARAPVLTQALEAGASPQIRNMATLGGNLLQAPRCAYFRDPLAACNLRRPGSGCGAHGGWDREQAVLGASAVCETVHPSDVAVALAALDAEVEVAGTRGRRRLPVSAFYRLPAEARAGVTSLEPGELVQRVSFASPPAGARQAYVKVRDRQSYAFALVSLAAVLETRGGIVHRLTLALGGVAPIPWRAREAEALARGRRLDEATIQAVADRALADARPLQHNGFKIGMARALIGRTLADLRGAA